MTIQPTRSEASQRGARMLRTALGASVVGWLDDAQVIEVMLNPDGRLWIDRLRTRAIVEVVIKLGATLGIRVVAEGVEKHEQAVHLAAVGCDHVQGYYFAEPLPGAEAGKRLGDGPIARSLNDGLAQKSSITSSSSNGN